MTDEPYDPGAEGAKMSFSGAMSYSDYLHLDAVLASQHPLTDAHDEMLFVIQHQTSEQICREKVMNANDIQGQSTATSGASRFMAILLVCVVLLGLR